MKKRFVILMVVTLVVLGVAAGAVLRPGLADAQAPFAGSWDMIDVLPAPWVEGDHESIIHEDIAKGRITFMASSVQAPGFLDCDKASFEIDKVPPEFLFQGGLTDPVNQATALGYKGGEIENLFMTCLSHDADMSMDFSLIDEDLIVFALDNMIYRMQRVPD